MDEKTYFKKGQRVTVYHDPITCQDPEGQATLQVFRYTGGWIQGADFARKIEWWIVKFADGPKALRKLVQPQEEAR
jgi:hypothetical protein